MTNNQGPSSDVGSELLFENDRVRVWSMTLQPGETSTYHRHENDYLFVYTTPSTISSQVGDTDGPTRNFHDGYVQYTEVGPGIEHSITNVAESLHHQIIVEIKGVSMSETSHSPENNGRVRTD